MDHKNIQNAIENIATDEYAKFIIALVNNGTSAALYKSRACILLPFIERPVVQHHGQTYVHPLNPYMTTQLQKGSHYLWTNFSSNLIDVVVNATTYFVLQLKQAHCCILILSYSGP